MPIPESPRVIFGRNPLKEVICQLRFPTILEISASEPADFQKLIRDTYPLYERSAGDIASPNMPEALAKLISQLGVAPPSTTTHTFSTEDEQSKITLTSDFVAISTRAYPHWDAFLSSIQLVTTTFGQIYHPAFYSRLGLRYQDVIDRDALELGNYKWTELIHPQFLGFLGLGEVEDEVLASAVEAIFSLTAIDGAKVKVRSGLATTKAEPPGPQVFLFDADFYTETKCGGADAIDRIKALHQHAGNLFRWVITERLYNALEPTGAPVPPTQ